MSDQATRQDGWYFVRWHPHSKWQPHEWGIWFGQVHHWLLRGAEQPVEIGLRIPMPDEAPATEAQPAFSNSYEVHVCRVCGKPKQNPYVILSEPTCECGEAQPAPPAACPRFRVGGKVPLNVYEGDRPVFQCHTPEDAARFVTLLNAGLERAPAERKVVKS